MYSMTPSPPCSKKMTLHKCNISKTKQIKKYSPTIRNYDKLCFEQFSKNNINKNGHTTTQNMTEPIEPNQKLPNMTDDALFDDSSLSDEFDDDDHDDIN